MVALRDRLRASVHSRGWSQTHELDRYLIANLPRLVREHEIATAENMAPIDTSINRNHLAITELEAWRATSTGRVVQIKKRIDVLEVKYGNGAK